MRVSGNRFENLANPGVPYGDALIAGKWVVPGAINQAMRCMVRMAERLALPGCEKGCFVDRSLARPAR